MKQYAVGITDEALADMEQLYNHIVYVLLVPENAIGQYNRITDEILKLEYLVPLRLDLKETEPDIMEIYIWFYFIAISKVIDFGFCRNYNFKNISL